MRFDQPGASTPWGAAQSVRTIAMGILFYSTAGHGGFHLSPGRLAELATCLHKRNSAYCPLDWFEEDSEAALVVAGFPQYFSAEQVQSAVQTIASYYPEKLGPYSGMVGGLGAYAEAGRVAHED